MGTSLPPAIRCRAPWNHKKTLTADHRLMAKKTFETALAKLEQITEELEAGDLSLEKSLDKFNEGIALVQFCSSRLDEAKGRVDLLLNKDGALTAMPFAEENGGD